MKIYGSLPPAILAIPSGDVVSLDRFSIAEKRWIEDRLLQRLSSVSHIRHFVGGLAGQNRPVSRCVVSHFVSKSKLGSILGHRIHGPGILRIFGQIIGWRKTPGAGLFGPPCSSRSSCTICGEWLLAWQGSEANKVLPELSFGSPLHSTAQLKVEMAGTWKSRSARFHKAATEVRKPKTAFMTFYDHWFFDTEGIRHRARSVMVSSWLGCGLPNSSKRSNYSDLKRPQR